MTTTTTITAPAPTAPDRPACAPWDTRCVRGCGERVLDSGDACSRCLMAEVDAQIAAVLGKERQR